MNCQSLAALVHKRDRPENSSLQPGSKRLHRLDAIDPLPSPRPSYPEAVGSIKPRVPRSRGDPFKVNFIRKDISLLVDEALSTKSCILVAPTGFGKTDWISCLLNRAPDGYNLG